MNAILPGLSKTNVLGLKFIIDIRKVIKLDPY